MAAARPSSELISPRADGSPAPLGLHDPLLLALLALVLVLQLVAWHALDGYQIADSVEYLERARSLVRGESMVDAGQIRPIGFSALLVPFFVVAEWLGVPDPRAIVWSTYLLQIALGLCLVHRVARVGAKLGGRTTGLVAGFVVGVNPVFLQYSAQAESGIAAALMLSLGLERFLDRDVSRRDAWIGAAWLGAAFLIAYKSIAIVAGIAIVLLVRDRWRGRRSWSTVGAGLCAAIALQSLVDWAMYGVPGVSVRTYLVENFGAVVQSFLHLIHQREAGARWYAYVEYLKGKDYVAPAAAAAVQYYGKQSRWWYFENLPQMFVWPILACMLLGIARAILRASWRSTFLLAPFVLFAVATTSKGSKDYRVWVLILAFLAPLAAHGAVWAFETVRSHAWRRAWVVIFVATSVVLGASIVSSLDTRHFRGYWRAIDAASAIAEGSRANAPAEGRASARLRVGSAYNWAVYMRESPAVELVKLPHQLNSWKLYTDSEKGDDLAALAELDLFITHQPMLQANPDLMSWVSEHYEVLELFFERGVHRELGPIYLLGRRTGRATAAHFFDRAPDADPDGLRRARGLGEPTEFAFTAEDGRVERLVFLGSQYRTLAPDGFGWITYHWFTPTGLTRDLTLTDRLTSLDERNTWQNDHAGAWGALPTSSWRARDLVSESFPLVPATDAFGLDEFGRDTPWRPIGGAYRRGEKIPVRLWMQVVERSRDDASVVVSRFTPVKPGTVEPLPALAPEGTEELPSPYPLAADGLLRVGAFFLPVHPLARLADDGRAVAD